MRATLALLLLTACVDGKELISPTEPEYQALCVDSLYTDSTKVCETWGTITITIQNPNPTP